MCVLCSSLVLVVASALAVMKKMTKLNPTKQHK